MLLTVCKQGEHIGKIAVRVPTFDKLILSVKTIESCLKSRGDAVEADVVNRIGGLTSARNEGTVANKLKLPKGGEFGRVHSAACSPSMAPDSTQNKHLDSMTPTALMRNLQ